MYKPLIHDVYLFKLHYKILMTLCTYMQIHYKQNLNFILFVLNNPNK